MKPTLIKGRTEIIAAIYDNEHLPTAVLANKDHCNPACLHSLRVGDEPFFDKILKLWLDNDGIELKNDEELELNFWPFFEAYPKQSMECHGCYFASDTDTTGEIKRHEMRHSEDACVKLTSDCA